MAEAKHVETGARVQVVLDLPVPGAWGADCTLGQVYVQAKDELEGMLRNLLRDTGYRVVGEPVILSITNSGKAR